MPTPIAAQRLADHGLILAETSAVTGSLVFERPAWLFGHRLKNCTVGAFSFWNASGHTAAYRTHFGRYTQIGESSIIGPPGWSRTAWRRSWASCAVSGTDSPASPTRCPVRASC